MPRTSHYADKPRRTTSSENAAPRPREAVSDAELDAYAAEVADTLPPLTKALLRGAAPVPTKILILTTFHLDAYVTEALRAGASGFLLKEATADQLIEAVRVIASGEAILAPSVTRRLLETMAEDPAAAGDGEPRSTCCCWSPADCRTPRSARRSTWRRPR